MLEDLKKTKSSEPEGATALASLKLSTEDRSRLQGELEECSTTNPFLTELPGGIELSPLELPELESAVLILGDEQYRRFLSFRREAGLVDIPGCEFDDTPVIVNESFLQGEQGVRLCLLLKEQRFFEFHLDGSSTDTSKPECLAQAYGLFLKAFCDTRADKALNDLEEISESAAYLALSTNEEEAGAGKEDWAKRYPETRIESPEQARAPLNDKYLGWLSKHPEAKKFYEGKNPNETADDQRESYLHFLGKGRDADGKVRHLCKSASPLLVPSKSSFVGLPLHIREQGRSGNPSYLQFAVKWGGEWLGAKNRRRNQIIYSCRWHTNTRKRSGQPPSSVVEREYQGKIDRLLLPSKKALSALENSEFKQYKRTDATGNVWIEGRGAELCSELRARIPEARILLEAMHFPYWKKS